MTLKPSELTIIYKTARQVLYFGILCAAIFFLHFLAKTYGADTFEEDSVVENMQFGMLLFTAGIFGLEAWKSPKYRLVLLSLASCCLLASCREMDYYFDKHLPIISWRIGFIFPIIALTLMIRKGKAVLQPLFRFLESPAFYMMCSVMVMLVPIAQCIGHRPFVIHVLGTYKMAEIKQLFEEGAEFIGYTQLILASVECYFDLLRKK
jgi:hypothetical protein